MKATHNLTERPELLEPEHVSRAGASPDEMPRPASTLTGAEPNRAAEEREPLTKTAADALCEIRLRSGLSWEQIGELFELSLRDVIAWSNGVALSAENERRVWRALDAIRHVDEGDLKAKRTTLDRILDASHGPSIFDLLTQRRYDEVLELPAGAGDPSPPYRCTTSDEVRGFYRPPPLLACLGAISDNPPPPAVNPHFVPMGRQEEEK